MEKKLILALPVYQKLKQDVSMRISETVLAAWAEQADYIVHTMLAGGGSVLFADFASHFPGGKVVDEPFLQTLKVFWLASSGLCKLKILYTSILVISIFGLFTVCVTFCGAKQPKTVTHFIMLRCFDYT